MPSTEVRGIIGTILRDDMREDHRGFHNRLRAVEIGFGKVDQRLETLERAIIPSAPPAE